MPPLSSHISQGTFRGLSLGHIPCLRRYAAQQTEETRKKDENFVSILGQVARVGLCTGVLDISELSQDLGLLQLSKEAVIANWHSWLVANKSFSTTASYCTQVKTGFRRLLAWLQDGLSVNSNGRFSQWIKTYKKVKGQWVPSYYTVEEVQSGLDEVRANIDGLLAQCARKAKNRLRHVKKRARMGFVAQYNQGELM